MTTEGYGSNTCLPSCRTPIRYDGEERQRPPNLTPHQNPARDQLCRRRLEASADPAANRTCGARAKGPWRKEVGGLARFPRAPPVREQALSGRPWDPFRAMANTVLGVLSRSAVPPAEPALACPLPASIPSSVIKPCQDQRPGDAAGAGADQQAPVPAGCRGFLIRRTSSSQVRPPQTETHRLPPARAPLTPAIRRRRKEGQVWHG